MRLLTRGEKLIWAAAYAAAYTAHTSNVLLGDQEARKTAARFAACAATDAMCGLRSVIGVDGLPNTVFGYATEVLK